MPLNKRESYVEIWGEDRNRGIVYGQNQDDGTGRSVRRNFNVNGWMVDDGGKCIDPDYISPEEVEKKIREAARARELEALAKAKDAEAAGLVWDKVNEPDLMLADRINIKNPSQSGFMEVEDIQKELSKLDVKYHWNAGREKLLNLLREELSLQ